MRFQYYYRFNVYQCIVFVLCIAVFVIILVFEKNGVGQKYLIFEYFGIIDNFGGLIFVDFIGIVYFIYELNFLLIELRNIVFIIVYRSKFIMFYFIEFIE